MKKGVLIILRILVACSALNEIRGLILAGPVLYGLYLNGGTWMAYWLAFCSLAGIALSVVVPLWLVRKAEATLLAPE